LKDVGEGEAALAERDRRNALMLRAEKQETRAADIGSALEMAIAVAGQKVASGIWGSVGAEASGLCEDRRLQEVKGGKTT
jgi:hypothetical protein